MEPTIHSILPRIKRLFYVIFKERKRMWGGFTLLELMVVVAILGALAGIGIPTYQSYIEKAKITKTIADIRTIEKEILTYLAVNGSLPESLADINRENFLDPWGNPYQYLNFATIKGEGGAFPAPRSLGHDPSPLSGLLFRDKAGFDHLQQWGKSYQCQ